jgi:branched-chain amino acid transport system substrate-binding protein
VSIKRFRTYATSIAASSLLIAGIATMSAFSANPAGATAAKAPIHVMVAGFFSGVGPYPDVEVGATAAIKAIDASGGIKGHKIDYTVCNDQNNPNLMQSCAESAVLDKDVAVVTGVVNTSASYLSTLAPHHISFIGNYVQSASDATSPVSFPLSGGAFDNAAGIGIAAVATGCTKVATIIGDYGSLTGILQGLIHQGITEKGGTDVGDIVVSTSATDLTPNVQAAVADGAQCIIGALGEAESVSLQTAIQQTGGGIYLVTFGSSLPPLDTVGTTLNGVYLMDQTAIPTDTTSAGVKLAKRQILQYGSGVGLSQDGISAWAGVQLLKAGLLKVTGTFTAASVLKSMNHLTNVTTGGIIPPYTTTHPSSVKAQPRVFNPTFLTYKITGANKTQKIGGFQVIPGFTFKP